jgi:hypothetical protein
MFSVTGGDAAPVLLLEVAVPAAVQLDMGLIDYFLLLPARRRGSSKRGQQPCEVLSLFLP